MDAFGMKMSRFKSIQSKVPQQTQSSQFVKTSFSLLQLSWLFAESVTSFNHGFPESRKQQWFPHRVQEKKSKSFSDGNRTDRILYSLAVCTLQLDSMCPRGEASSPWIETSFLGPLPRWYGKDKENVPFWTVFCCTVALWLPSAHLISLCLCGFLYHIWSPDIFQTLLTEHSHQPYVTG